MHESSKSMVSVSSEYLANLKKKALAWDELQEDLEEIYSARLRASSLARDGNPDMARVPFDQTIIIINLPHTVGGIELMNSVLAPGGIRCYQMFSETGRSPNTCTVLITFVMSDASKNYLSYVSKHGFFIAEKLPADRIADPRKDEYVGTSIDRKSRCLFRRLPSVVVKPWVGIERVTGKLITGDEGGYCNVSSAIKDEGATRVLIISPGMEPKEVHEELKHLVAVPRLKIESSRLVLAPSPSKENFTIMQFYSIRDAVMAKSYLSFLKSFSGPEGRTVEYSKDPMDRPTADLGWHNFTVPKMGGVPPVSANLAPTTAKATNEKVEPISTKDIVTLAKIDIPNYSPYVTAESGAGESDADDDVREISFSLAKEAFLPYIKTSPNKLCFPSLCHTPAPGDHTPATPLEYAPQLGQQTESKNLGLEEKNNIALIVNGGEKIADREANSFPQIESIPSSQMYPHEANSSKEKSHDVLSKDSFGNASAVEKILDRPFLQMSVTNETDPGLKFKSVPLLTPYLRFSSLNGTVGYSGVDSMAQPIDKAEEPLSHSQQAAGLELKTDLGKKSQLDKQSLRPMDWNQNQPKVMGVPAGVSLPKKPSFLACEDPLRSWENDF